MTDPVRDARTQLSEALAARNGEPASDPAEAAHRVEDLRLALTRDLDALRTRIPDPAEITAQSKRFGAMAGGGAAGLITLIVARQRRSHRAAEEAAVRTQAVALARALSRLEMEPDDLLDEDSGGWIGKALAALALLGGVAGGIVAIRQRLTGDDDVWDQPV